MKFALKAAGLLFTGLLTTVIIYPFLHEAGHLIAAAVAGASVVKIGFIPLPFVMCDASGVGTAQGVIIGAGGFLLPLLAIKFIDKKKFWGWYIRFLLKGESSLAFAISAISAACFALGTPLPQDDTTQILQIWQNGTAAVFIISILLCGLTALSIIKERPLTRCCAFLA